MSAKELATYAEALEAFEEQERHKDVLRDNLNDNRGSR